MIVIGYPGIGKSTLAGRDNKYIDLESGCFWVDGKRADDWYVAYCQVAEHLSRQGYIVFVSSHAAVVDFLCRIRTSVDEPVAVVYPSIVLRDQWVEKLRQRFDESGLEKDLKAWTRSIVFFDADITELAQAPGVQYRLTLVNMDYDLKEAMEKLESRIV